MACHTNRFMNFVHLHVHSWYSCGSGVANLEALCKRAHSWHMPALALTDTNNLYGMMPFLQVAKEHALLPVIGCELTDSECRALVWVATDEGYRNLCHLISQRHCNPDFSLIQCLPQQRAGLILASDNKVLLQKLLSYERKDLYVELSPGYHMHECLAFAKRHHLPVVATNRVTFLEQEHYVKHQLLYAMHHNTKLSRLPPEALVKPHNFFCNQDFMAHHFPHVPEALANTWKIAERCKTHWDFSRLIFPSLGGQGKKLYALALAGCRKRYTSLTPQVLKRLEHEMDIIEQKGFADYFLVVRDIVQQSSLTCGRGSAAASLVAYALEITHVDPIRYHLHFERFLNLSRKDPPDIDVDFAWDERDHILDTVFSTHQARRVAMVANHVMLRARAAIRETAKIHGFPETAISRITKKGRRASPFHRNLESLQSDPFHTRWADLFNKAAELEGVFRYLSVHCGGIVIVPDDIRNHVPVEIAPKGVPVLQWDKEGVEAAGLVKIDLLGNRSLAVIRDTLAAIHAHGGPDMSYAELHPQQDPETLRLFYQGRTLGIFYFESPATRLLLQKVGASMSFEKYCKEDHFLVNTLVTSIIRPASNTFIHEWIERLRGKPWQPLHPLLTEPLAETLGILVYQEQLSLVAIHLAGFSADLADDLRRVISKKHREKKMKDFLSLFTNGACNRGVDQPIIQKVWDMMLSFSGYSFCKPHSASYTMVAYKATWLKAHYPAAFMAAVISNQGGYYSTFAYISACRRMGIQVLQPDINTSDIKDKGWNQRLRLGFQHIKGLKTRSTTRILDVRAEGGSFTSCDSFMQRTALEPEQIRLLIRAGCFDTLHEQSKRPELIWSTHLNPAQKEQPQMDLWETQPAPPIPQTPPYNEADLQQHELDILGFPLTCHPLDLFQTTHTPPIHWTTACELPKQVGQNITLAGWLITAKWVLSKKEEPMEFVTFEDRTALFETVIFPKVYQKYGHLLGEPRPYLITGRATDDQGTTIVHVTHLKLL